MTNVSLSDMPAGRPSWRDYWNGDSPIYVSERHKILHDARVAKDVAALIPRADAVLLDHGCGEARSADVVARACATLWMSDGASNVLARVAQRFRHEPKIATLAPEEIDARIPDGSLDMVVANSLAQYLSREDLKSLLALWRRKLGPGGRLVLGDIVPPGLSPLTDATALLRFGAQGGFLVASLLGLVRTAFSTYRTLRDELGLTTWSEADMLALLEEAGYAARRHRPNIGHNQARMTFLAEKRA